MVIGCSALQCNIVLHVRTCTEHLIYIVHVIPTICWVIVRHFLNMLAGEDRRILRTVSNNTVGQLIHHVSHIVIVGKLGAVHELGEIGIHRNTILTIVAHFRLTLVTFLCGNDNHTTARVQTIHRCCRTVLQNRYRLDVVRVNIINATWHTVNDV